MWLCDPNYESALRRRTCQCLQYLCSRAASFCNDIQKLPENWKKQGLLKKLPRHKWRILSEPDIIWDFSLWHLCRRRPWHSAFRVYERRLSLFYEQISKTMSGTSGICRLQSMLLQEMRQEIFIWIIFRIICILEKVPGIFFRPNLYYFSQV